MEEFSQQMIPLKTKKEIKEGIVRLVQYDIILNDYAVWLDLDGDKVIIPRQELELYEIKGGGLKSLYRDEASIYHYSV